MRFFLCLLKTSIRNSLSLKWAFFIELILNIGNNAIFFFMWWIFFQRFPLVGSWNFQDLLIMMAIVRGGYGLSRICFGGTKLLADAIITGGLDRYMTQPKSPLFHLLGSKSQSKGWSHLLSSILLCAFAEIHPLQLPLILLGIVCTSLIFTATSTIAHSLCFWFGNIGEVSKRYVDSVFLFVHYPVNIYSGLMQVCMFTILPAGVIGYLPVQLVKTYSWTLGFCLLGASALFVSISFFVFYRGLRRYTSGNLFI